MINNKGNLKRKEVLLKGWYGQDNIGDDLLLIEALYNLPQNWQIFVEGETNDFINFQFIRHLIVISQYDKKSRTPKIVFYHGGGIFPSLRLSYGTFVTLIKEIIIPKHLLFFGIGISPKNGIKNSLYYLLFKKAKFITVRDDISKQYLENIGIKNVINTGDIIWINKDRITLTTPLLKNKNILICLAQPYPIADLNDPHNQKRYENFVCQIQKVIIYLQNKGFFLWFVPFLKADDTYLINKIIPVLDIDNYTILNVGNQYQLENINSLFKSADYSFCMRFHSKLLSIKNQLPFVGICYDFKSECLLEECGISETGLRYGIRPDACFGEEVDIKSDEIIQKFEYVFKNEYEIRKKMNAFSDKKIIECEIRYTEMIEFCNGLK